jgi:hypothetical protein
MANQWLNVKMISVSGYLEAQPGLTAWPVSYSANQWPQLRNDYCGCGPSVVCNGVAENILCCALWHLSFFFWLEMWPAFLAGWLT